MDVQKQDRELGYKQTADKIRQILSKVRETPRSSYKRWVWELLQNAKDVKDPSFGSVSVKITLNENELVFSHNGLPFQVRHLLGIVKQVSTKSSTGEDETVTGKFGTGFIVTHLLSDIIDVQGYIHDENGSYYRLNNLRLDRSGSTSEELIPKIEEANEYIIKIEKEPSLFPEVPDYPNNKKKDSFDTVFKYTLSSNRKKEAAKEGIVDLKNTLPVTLVSVEEIGEVIIEDKLSLTTYHYRITPAQEESGVKMMSVELQDGQTRSFLKFLKEDFCLITEVTDFDSFSLVERTDDQPVLYRNFPLIGSENFHFPFILNGFEFNPSENRNDIVLVDEESHDVVANRSILESAVAGAIEFTKFLISKNAKNRHLCAISRIPKLSVPIEEGLKDWLETLQLDWRKRLIDLDLIKTENDEYSSLRKCRLPNHGSSNEQKGQFHSLASTLLGKNIVPKGEDNLSWITMTGPKSELESWQLELWYYLEDLLSELEDLGNIEVLSKKIDNPIEWLNKLYTFIHEVKETELYDDYAIIPNHLGSFKKLEDLYLEDPNSKISDSFLDILENLEENWRDDLVHREVKLTGISIKTKGLSDVSKTINEILNVKERNSNGFEEYIFKSRDNAFSVLKEILCNVESVQTNDFRCKIYLKAKSIFSFEEDLKTVPNVKDFQFFTATKLFIMFIHEEIQACEDIEGLASKLNFDNTDTIFWLNEYFELILNKEDFKAQIEYGNIIPNREGNFCAFEDVYSFGTEETQLDDELIQILFELDENQNWRNELLYDGISLKLVPRKFEELGSTIDDTIKELEKEETFNPGSLNSYKQPIYKLLDWCKNHEELTEKYLKHTGARSNELWVKFSMTPEIMKVLRDEKSIEVLSIIAESGVSPEGVKQLLSIINQLGEVGVDGIKAVLEHAEDLLEEEKHFHFMRRTGENIEVIIRTALKEESIEDIVIEQRSKGSHDLHIYKSSNQNRIVKLEIKSYSNGSRNSFKFAPSQIKEANTSDNFLVCMLERPQEGYASTDYVRDKLEYRSNFADVITENVLHDLRNFEQIEEAQGNIRLVINQDGRPRIHVDFQLMKENCRTFQGLIHAIKYRLDERAD